MALENVDTDRCLSEYETAFHASEDCLGPQHPTTQLIQRNWRRYQQQHQPASWATRSPYAAAGRHRVSTSAPNYAATSPVSRSRPQQEYGYGGMASSTRPSPPQDLHANTTRKRTPSGVSPIPTNTSPGRLRGESTYRTSRRRVTKGGGFMSSLPAAREIYGPSAPTSYALNHPPTVVAVAAAVPPHQRTRWATPLPPAAGPPLDDPPSDPMGRSCISDGRGRTPAALARMPPRPAVTAPPAETHQTAAGESPRQGGRTTWSTIDRGSPRAGRCHSRPRCHPLPPTPRRWSRRRKRRSRFRRRWQPLMPWASSLPGTGQRQRTTRTRTSLPKSCGTLRPRRESPPPFCNG
ncbi:hypothetical protein AGDE_16151 [Angomonas deanei]|uniref:Uncharacterized protein n=1 Tax=Angomonas deanei TaxID=59799 RepID=A0A7G2C8H2_9TRYP|nr:hypothetical protein AGDE_16151 [Angomonas deanei]CAD2216028.1 hypothetical protein, conserved [Angomonas deanei]|eukprot:EPY17627.1 hypothetical protein AGDE_16151 [Angomonas deanei]